MAFPLVFWFLVLPPGATIDCLLGASLYRDCCSSLGRPIGPVSKYSSYATTAAWLLSSTLVLPDPPASCTLLCSLTHAACINSFSFSARHTPVVLTLQLMPFPAFISRSSTSRSCHGPASVSDPSGPSPVVCSSLIIQCYALLANGLARSTRQTYSTGQRLFADFCAMARIVPLPADEWSLMLFITWLHSVRHLSPATVSVYLASVRSLHVDRGFPDPLNDTPRLHRVLRGIQRSSASPRSSRLPVTQPILLAIQSAFSLAVFDHCMFWAACSLAFFGFLPVSEFTCFGPFDPRIHLSLSDVWFDPSGSIRLLIKSSKTDPFCRGVILSIGPSGHSLCLVSALRHYLQLRGFVPGPLFVSSHGCLLSPFLVNPWLRSILATVGLSGNYSSHSFRIGAATSAAAAEVPDHLIKTLCHWFSNACQLYIRFPLTSCRPSPRS